MGTGKALAARSLPTGGTSRSGLSAIVSLLHPIRPKMFLKVFRYSFSEAIPIFFNRVKSNFNLVRSL